MSDNVIEFPKVNKPENDNVDDSMDAVHNIVEDMQKQKASEERTTKNYERELEINQKELKFLREELRDTKVCFKKHTV